MTVRISDTKQDQRNGYNRAANVRLIGPGSPAYERFYHPLRSDVESLNREIEDSMYRHQRAHSVGWRRQLVDMMGFGLLTNSMTIARSRRSRDSMAA